MLFGTKDGRGGEQGAAEKEKKEKEEERISLTSKKSNNLNTDGWEKEQMNERKNERRNECNE